MGPDGIAVSTTSPRFVLVNGNDGTIRRLDFAGGDFSQEPTVSTFASGGFRGDMSSVGPDGCLYVSQDGARFDDLSRSGENSVVRLCAEDGGGFSPPGCPLPVSSPADTCVTAEVVSTITVTAPALVAFPPLAVGGTSPLVAAPVNVKSNGGGYQLSVTRTVFTRGDIPLSIELGASADADQISDLAGASPIPTSGNLNIGHRTGSITPAGGDTWATSMRLGPVPPVASGTHASIVTFTAVAFRRHVARWSGSARCRSTEDHSSAARTGQGEEVARS